MYKVMIVDDEAAHRKGMISLLNRIKPDYFLLEARDGNMAELILDTVDVDIIMTDIRMPNKDGLEFLADLHRASHRAKVIIVSGYGQFSYAKTALANGAFDYLLKPVDPQELEGTLGRAEGSVEEDRIKQHHQRRYIDMLMVKMVKSSLTEEEEKQLEGVLPEEAAGFVLTVKNKMRKDQSYNFMEWNQRIRHALEKWGHTMMFEVYDDMVTWAGFVFLRGHCEQEEHTALLNEYKTCIRQILPEDMDFGLSSITDNLYGSAAEAYRQSAAALSETFYTGSGGIIYTNETCGSEQKVLALLAEKEDELANLLQYGDHPRIKAQLETLFGQIPSVGLPNPNRLKELFILLGMRTVNWLQKKGGMADYHSAISVCTRRIMEQETMEQLRTEVENLFLMLNDISRQGRKEKMQFSCQ